MIRGVNIAGAEFGEQVLPGVHGTHYTFNSPRTFEYFAARGLRTFRVPLRWERLQPAPFGPLDPHYLNLLRANIGWAGAAGGAVIPELHNFGWYYDRPASPGELADVWVRLSEALRGDLAVHAYDLMNEPQGAGNWEAASQAAVAAIRASGDERLILVPGDDWSSADRWPRTHRHGPWIDDPAGNIAYEAHLYFDPDGSGRYREPHDRSADGVGRRRLDRFAGWCSRHGVRGFLGEYGVPADDPRWLSVLDDLLDALDELGMDGLYWAAGEWWPPEDRLSVQPEQDFAVDRPQMAVLARHLGE